jgi:ribonuclease HII
LLILFKEKSFFLFLFSFILIQNRHKNKRKMLQRNYNDMYDYEIGVDEAGRGPLFGRVYAAAVILPHPSHASTFDFSLMKDSKKFSSSPSKKTKIQEVAEYIQTHAIACAVAYEDEKRIDEINILQATQDAMHAAIRSVMEQLVDEQDASVALLVDGNYFRPIPNCDWPTYKMEGGDNTYASIAAASILAKVSRDAYIANLCAEHPTLDEHYGIASNKGYGAKRHLDGIRAHGITPWHRRTFGICKTFS